MSLVLGVSDFFFPLSVPDYWHVLGENCHCKSDHSQNHENNSNLLSFCFVGTTHWIAILDPAVCTGEFHHLPQPPPLFAPCAPHFLFVLNCVGFVIWVLLQQWWLTHIVCITHSLTHSLHAPPLRLPKWMLCFYLRCVPVLFDFSSVGGWCSNTCRPVTITTALHWLITVQKCCLK